MVYLRFLGLPIKKGSFVQAGVSVSGTEHIMLEKIIQITVAESPNVLIVVENYHKDILLGKLFIAGIVGQNIIGERIVQGGKVDHTNVLCVVVVLATIILKFVGSVIVVKIVQIGGVASLNYQHLFVDFHNIGFGIYLFLKEIIGPAKNAVIITRKNLIIFRHII
jgi:hypothetical protein